MPAIIDSTHVALYVLGLMTVPLGRAVRYFYRCWRRADPSDTLRVPVSNERRRMFIDESSRR